MLKYDEKLEADNFEITKADSILTLTTEKEAHYFGVLDFNGRYTKVIPFIKSQNSYKGRLILDESDLKYLDKSSFYIEGVSQGFTKRSNSINLTFQIDKIKLNVKKERAEQYLETLKEVRKLKDDMTNVLKGNLLSDISLKNMRSIKPGMVPVAIDSKGNFVATYPFADIIREINGIKALDEKVIIKPEDIPFKSGTLQEALDKYSEAIKGLKGYTDTLSTQIKELNKKLAELTIAYESHTGKDFY